MNTSEDLALRRARQWLSNARDRREHYTPPAQMSVERMRHMEQKLSGDIKAAEALICSRCSWGDAKQILVGLSRKNCRG